MALKCDGCKREIVEGQHFIGAQLLLSTQMPEGWQPVRDAPVTAFQVIAHNPLCMMYWMLDNEIIKDVFLERR